MRIRYFQCLLIFFLYITLVGTSYAAEFTINPSLNLKGAYDDNIYFSRTDKRGDYIGTISPGLAFNYTAERLNAGVRAGVGIVKYHEYTRENTTKQNYGLNAGYKIFQRLTFDGTASYTKDTTLDTYLAETGIVEQRSDIENYGAGGGLSYQISEVSNMSLNYNYTKTDYDLIQYTDSEGHSTALSYSHSFNNRLDTVSLRPYYRRTDSDENTVDTYGVSLGLAHTFTETLKGRISAGPRRTEIEKTTGQQDVDRGWTADAGLEKTWQTASAQLAYSRDISSTAEGDTVESNRFTLSVSKMLTSKLSSQLAGSLYFTKSKGSETQDTNTRFYTVTPSFNYNFTNQISLNLAYSYSNVYDKTQTDDREGDRHTVWIALNFNFPQKW